MIRLLLMSLLFLPTLVLGKPPVVLVLGDSLSAGYGLDREDGWVWLLGNRLKEQGLPHQVVNAGISGDTTAGGLTRLPSLLAEHRPAVMVVELGANDGLRGLSFETMRQNMAEIIRQGRAAGSRILIVGVQLPPNYGAVYNRGFQDFFHSVSQTENLPLVPDLLKGVADHWELMQADGLHPKAEAQPRILENVWPALEPLLRPTATAVKVGE